MSQQDLSQVKEQDRKIHPTPRLEKICQRTKEDRNRGKKEKRNQNR